MATPTLNTELLGFFTPVFTFILIFAVVYALLQYGKMLGDNKLLHSAIAFTIAVFGALLSSQARQMIEYMVPWFTVLMIFTVLVIMMYKIFGASDDDMKTVIRKHTGIQWTIGIICIVIALGALSNSFGQKALGSTNPNGEAPSNTGTEGTSGTVNSDDRPYSTTEGSTATGDFSTNLSRSFYHPKVIGMVFLLIVAAFTVQQLSRPVSKGWP